MSWCWCGGSNPCNNMLLKYFWFDCSTWAAGKYVVNVTKDTCGNCNAYFVPETAASAFDCNNVTTCIDTNAGTKTAIKNLLISLINSDAAVQSAICWVNCGVSTPANITNLTTTDSNGGVYDCGNPILNWTTSAWATSYDIFEWATLLGNTIWTTFTVAWASVWSHTYTVIAKNAWGSASWVNATVNVVACLAAPWNVTGTINVYDSGTVTNYACGLWFDVNFTDVSGATYYQLFEWATQIGSNSATSNFVVTGQTAGSHTYTIKACNWAWCSTGTNFSVTIAACANKNVSIPGLVAQAGWNRSWWVWRWRDYFHAPWELLSSTNPWFYSECFFNNNWDSTGFIVASTTTLTIDFDVQAAWYVWYASQSYSWSISVSGWSSVPFSINHWDMWVYHIQLTQPVIAWQCYSIQFDFYYSTLSWLISWLQMQNLVIS